MEALEEQIYRERLLAGLPLYVDKIPVYSPKLIQIANIGFPIYNTYLSICVNDNMSPQHTKYENKFLNVLRYDLDYHAYFILGLEFFTGKRFVWQDTHFAVEGEDLRLDSNNFNELMRLLRLTNCFPEKDIKIKRNKELDRKIAEAKRKIREQLGREPDDDRIEFADLVSVLAAKHPNLNIVNVWELTYFQFNNQFQRMQLIESYDFGVRQILAGFDKDKVKLQHYIKKIK